MNTKTSKSKSGLPSRSDPLTATAATPAAAPVSAPEPTPAPAPEPKPERPAIDFNRRHHNRALPQPDLLALLKDEAPDFFARARVVGRWVWVAFTERQPSSITAHLAELGFHWNNTRQTWQHPCGPVDVDASPADPRTKYGSRPAAELFPA